MVDQFEEVFTLCHDLQERQRFIGALLTAARAANGRCRVVLGVRADFYAHCTAYTELVEALRDSQVIVGPMTIDELRLAISQPAVRSGYAVETALLTELIAEVNGQVGVLPLLSHALLETWRRRRGSTLTLAGFQAAGGIEGALAQTAEAAYARLVPRQQQVAKEIMLRLTALGESTEDTKRRVIRAELDDDPDTRAVLDQLVRARLVAIDRDAVEISHEALIRSWPRLRGWLTEDREGLRVHRELTEATDTWESLERDAGALYRGVRLARAQEWAAQVGPGLTARERAFLTASLVAQVAEQRLTQRRARRLRGAVALLSALLVLAVAATVFAVEAQRTAARQRNVALSQIVAGKAIALRPIDPALAAQLSLAAYRLSPTAEARASLRSAYPFPYRRLARHTGNVNDVVFSPDGTLLATASHDRTARLWDVRDQAAPVAAGVLQGHTENVNTVAFSPDGRVVATGSWDHTAKLWDVSDPQRPAELATLRGHTDDVNAVVFSPDGRRLVTTSTDHTAKLWDITDHRAPRLVRTLSGHTDAVATAAFRPGGSAALVTAGFDGTVRLWQDARPVGSHRCSASSPSRSPGSRSDRTAGVGHGGPGGDGLGGGSGPRRQSWALTDHERTVRTVAYSPDGQMMASGGEDKKLRLWDVSQRGVYRPDGPARGARGLVDLGRLQPGGGHPGHRQRRRHRGALADPPATAGQDRHGAGRRVGVRFGADPDQRGTVGHLFPRGEVSAAVRGDLASSRGPAHPRRDPLTISTVARAPRPGGTLRPGGTGRWFRAGRCTATRSGDAGNGGGSCTTRRTWPTGRPGRAVRGKWRRCGTASRRSAGRA